MILPAGRIHSTIPSVDRVECVVLRQGTLYMIAARPSGGEIVRKMASSHGTGKRYVPWVVLKNGQERRIIISSITEITGDKLVFTGIFPNGNELVVADIIFSGASEGSVRIKGVLG
jgi:hypothetical protein